jgi:hypothetical protein
MRPIIILAFLYFAVSTMDYNDQVSQGNHYTTMVCSGHWPDYKQINPECGDYEL